MQCHRHFSSVAVVAFLYMSLLRWSLLCFYAPLSAKPQGRFIYKVRALVPPKWRSSAGECSTTRSVLPAPAKGNLAAWHALRPVVASEVILGTVGLAVAIVVMSVMVPAPHHCSCHGHHAHAHAHEIANVGKGVLGSFGDSLGFFSWLASPGRPDPQFGGLCVWSNLFFALLAPVFWLKRMVIESLLVILVVAASTAYHSFQIHAAFGPLHQITRFACVSDICLAVSFAAILAWRHPRTRNKALPAVAGAAVCFILPTFLPNHLAEVGYSWLHSAWHGFSAWAAYMTVGAPTVSVEPAREAVASLLLRFPSSLLRRHQASVAKVLLLR